MLLARPVFAQDPRGFGRARARAISRTPSNARIGDDAKLFMATFIAGFLFVSILIA